MLVLFLMALWAGPAGAAPAFNPAWAANANKVIGPDVREPV
jgi:hypothetical protein